MSTLNHFLQSGKPRKAQLNIIDIFNVPDTLLQRGFEEVTENAINETLINAEASPIFNLADDGFSFASPQKPKEFIDKFNDKGFRLEMRNMVFGIEQNHSQDEYEFGASPTNEKRYSNTVELLVAYLSVKELQALSASFGVKIKNAPDGGDFDCIANFQNSLFHFEIKSGNVRNIDEDALQCFLNRHVFLAPEASVLFLDYQGGNSRDLDNLILKFKDLKIGDTREVEQIYKIKDGSRKFYTLDGDLLVIDLHNNADILSNLRSAMQYFHRYNATNKMMGYLITDPTALGYEGTVLG